MGVWCGVCGCMGGHVHVVSMCVGSGGCGCLCGVVYGVWGRGYVGVYGVYMWEYVGG